MRAVDAKERIRSLAATAHALSRPETVPRLVELAAEEALLSLLAASVSVSRLEPGTWNIRTLVNVGDLGPDEVRWPENELYNIDDFAYLNDVMVRFTTWIADVDDPHTEPAERRLLEKLGKGSSMAAPLMVDGHVWGEFYATRHRGEPTFDSDDIAYLDALTAIVGAAISRAQREASLEQLAFHDPLTGLLNRRSLDEQAALAFDVPPGVTRNITMVVVDINALKQVNDAHGHAVGDQLILSVARNLKRLFSELPGSLVARVGGDEFTVMVPGHRPDLVVSLCDQLCAESFDLDPAAGVSCGVASAELTHLSTVGASDLFAAADRAQYTAKRSALRRTVLADDFAAEDVCAG